MITNEKKLQLLQNRITSDTITLNRVQSAAHASMAISNLANAVLIACVFLVIGFIILGVVNLNLPTYAIICLDIILFAVVVRVIAVKANASFRSLSDEADHIRRELSENRTTVNLLKAKLADDAQPYDWSKEWPTLQEIMNDTAIN